MTPLRRPLAAVAFALALSCSTAQQHHAGWSELVLRFLGLRQQGEPVGSTSKEKQFLLPSDYEAAANIPEYDASELPWDAFQNPALFEGDITGIAFDLESDETQNDAADPINLPQHSALNLGTYPDKLWPRGRIPYKLEEGLKPRERAAIAQAFIEYKNKTCIQFVPKNDDDFDYLYIMRNRQFGCSSYVGKAGGNQTVSLESGKCFTKGIIAHEFMHALGFFHEHSRTDRDKFVEIIEDNVKPGMLRNFQKYPRKVLDLLEMPYDYGSVMHYHRLAFSRNGKATIRPRDADADIGQRFRLSAVDAQKVNKLYDCAPDGAATPKPDNATDAPPAKECVDLNEHCHMWSEIGHCKWSGKYMNHYCKKACGLCDDERPPPIRPNSRCLDRNLFCGYWARIGECKAESKFMKIFCKRSCNVCSD